MRYWPTILLACLYVVSIACLYAPWPAEKQNWIFNIYMPMSVTWNIRYLSGQVEAILIGFMMLQYGKTPNRVNHTSVIVFILWAFLDSISYFYNYKTEGYYIIYGVLAVAWFLIHKYKPRQKWTTQTQRK